MAGVPIVGPADFATQQVIRQAVLQFIARGNAERPPQLYSLWTDEFIASSKVSVDDLDPGMAVNDSGPIALIDIPTIQLLSDGHVVAVVLFDSQDQPVPVEAYAFSCEEVGGRWLLDGLAF